MYFLFSLEIHSKIKQVLVFPLHFVCQAGSPSSIKRRKVAKVLCQSPRSKQGETRNTDYDKLVQVLIAMALNLQAMAST